MQDHTLFTPLTLPNGTRIENRFFKSAMHEALGDKNRQPTQNHVNLYRRWAEGQAGILVTGNVMVDRKAIAEPGNVVFDDQTDMQMLKAWAQAGQSKGNHLWIQLNHPGKSIPIAMRQETVAPSAIGMRGDVGKAFAIPKELTLAEIKTIIEAFAHAALIAKLAGFSGVQIHGAHGYLVNQFLSPADNHRKDLYGGSLENRMRFLVDIYQAIRKKVGSDFPIGLKLNPSDFTPEGFSEKDSIEVIKKMTALGIDLIEISGGNYESQKMASTGDQVLFLDFAQRVKSIKTAPIVLTGGFKEVQHMTKALDEGVLDMIGIARAMVMAPDMVKAIREGDYQTVALPRFKTGFKQLDRQVGAIAAISFYEEQMERLAQGLQPRYSENAWKPLSHAIRRYGLAALMPKRG